VRAGFTVTPAEDRVKECMCKREDLTKVVIVTKVKSNAMLQERNVT
jgi:hypothetical protein